MDPVNQLKTEAIFTRNDNAFSRNYCILVRSTYKFLYKASLVLDLLQVPIEETQGKFRIVKMNSNSCVAKHKTEEELSRTVEITQTNSVAW